MTWREELGEQIRLARAKAGLTQAELAEMTSIKREHISNIELGKNSPAVKIVTEIAKALKTPFRLDGCVIEPASDSPGNNHPAPVPRQMTLDFGVEYRFDARLLAIRAHSDTEFELRAMLSEKRRA